MAKSPADPDVRVPSVFVSLSSGRLLESVIRHDGGETLVTLTPAAASDDWPSILSSAFIACVVMTVVLSALWFLQRPERRGGAGAGVEAPADGEHPARARRRRGGDGGANVRPGRVPRG